jgi:hypothetical protein
MKRLRILAVADLWQGSDAYAYVRAFRRLGHSVRVAPSEDYIPGKWTSKPLRALRRLAEPLFVREYSDALIREAEHLRPHLFFVFKGRYVTPEALAAIRRMGAVAVNFYPDVSFMAHGKYIPQSLPVYDWVFTAKSFGIGDMKKLLGVERASMLPPSFDPEVHAPLDLDEEDRAIYECDVSFIGTWSPKKQRLIEAIAVKLPDARVRVWGEQWSGARASLGSRLEGRGVLGIEYSKAMIASKINLSILSEARRGSSSGDRITARTFQIPATGAFMLHERTDELLEYFREGVECACFSSDEEMVDKIACYLGDPQTRSAMAAAGLTRSIESGYCVDHRAAEILEKAAEIGLRVKSG